MAPSADNKTEAVIGKLNSDLPPGRYRIVGWAIDTTGKRITDEIWQIAGYTPNSQFEQYIMPYRNLNIFTQRRYGIRVITMRRYRLLKDFKSNQFLKTKSEISTLTDFLNWLESLRGDSVDGIILMFHEMNKISPAMLLEALRRYNLYDRFTSIVVGFYNNYPVSEVKCNKTMRPYSLKILNRVLLNNNDNLSTAVERAKVCYNIVHHLGKTERQDVKVNNDGDASTTQKITEEFVRQYACSISTEEKYILELKNFILRQNTLRPVFKDLLSFNRISRQNATRLRRRLAENHLDLDQVKKAWDNGGKKSIEELLMKITAPNKKEYTDILEILECYFDSSKKLIVENFSRRRGASSKSQKENQKKTNETKTFSEASADSGTSSPQDASPRQLKHI